MFPLLLHPKLALDKCSKMFCCTANEWKWSACVCVCECLRVYNRVSERTL